MIAVQDIIVKTHHNVSVHVEFSDQGCGADAFIYVDDRSITDIGQYDPDGITQADVDYLIDQVVDLALVIAVESRDESLRMSLMRSQPYIV
jgi:hypothetical protein